MSGLVVPSPFIADRSGFGWMCDAFGYRTLVEVGVNHGAFSRTLIAGSHGTFLYAVDPWLPCLDMPEDRGAAETSARRVLSEFAGRYEVVKSTSLEAARSIRGVTDFVYLDGSHIYEDVVADLEAWWPRIPGGGMLAGHDLNYDPVRAAVMTFFKDRTLYLIPELHLGVRDRHPSWYAFKTL